MPKLPSKVWNYFVNKPDNPKVTICQVSITNPLTSINEKCNKEMAYSMGSTSAMSRHLKTLHNIHIHESEANSKSFTSNQTNEHSPKQSIISSSGEALARCAADLMSINTILNSDILKDYLDKVHQSQMPKTEEEFNEIIIEYYNQVVEEYKRLFEHLKTKNTKFYITVDNVLIEFFRKFSTEMKRRNILTVHCNIDSKIKSFELAYSALAFYKKQQIENELKIFGLDLDSDIVGCTSEFNINRINQVSLKLTIGRTVKSVLNENDITKWARTLSRSFLYLKKLKCIRERKDDWSKTKDMMERLVLLQPYIKLEFDNGELGFRDRKCQKENVYYDEHKFNELKSIVDCLKMLEETVAELDKPNSNLLTADETMKNVFMKLRQCELDFGTTLINKLNEEYAKVRNQNIISLMHFLEHRKHPINRFERFEYSTKAEIIQTANDLNQRLFCKKILNQRFDEDLTSHFELTEVETTLSPQLHRLNKVLLTIRPVVTCKGKILFLELSNIAQMRENVSIPKLTSQVWHYFSFKPDNPKVTICQITTENVKCNKPMSYKSSSTSAMARHLKGQHNIIIDKSENQIKLQTGKVISTNVTQFRAKERN